MITTPHFHSLDYLYEQLSSSPKGLIQEQIREKQQKYGLNKLPEPKLPGPFLVFINQFRNTFIYVLLFAAAISLVIGEFANTIFIFIVLLINAGLGTYQDLKAQKQIHSLKNMVPKKAIVIRNGQTQEVHSYEIVPGDILLLTSGDKVSADIRLSHSKNLQVDESMLTGESDATLKAFNAQISETALITERSNLVYAGTIVNQGRGKGIVVATGAYTQFGQIANTISRVGSKPPLLIRFEKFTQKIMFLIIAIAGLMIPIVYIRGTGLNAYFFMTLIALMVSAIPEGLLAATTIALSNAARRMAAQNVIIQKLMAVETLGSCTLIAMDKTGTLTLNELTANYLSFPNGSNCVITGRGLEKNGIFKPRGEFPPNLENIHEICLAGVLTNEATLTEDKNGFCSTGDKVDIALLVMGVKAKIQLNKLQKDYPIINTLPYESKTAFSGSLNKIEGRNILSVKGRPDKILNMCTHMRWGNASKPIDQEKLQKQYQELASDGYRVIAIAQKEIFQEDANIDPQKHLNRLVFLGFIGMIDPIRYEAKQAIASCHKAHVQTIMITGDNVGTAFNVGRKLGIISDKSKVVTGIQIQEADDKGELDKLIESTSIFAQVDPHQKQKLIQAFIRKGHFVAVTGDGINDVPAIRQAHIGISMGKSGTEITRESSDLILLDDNFTSIVNAIKQGRIVYNNIRKAAFLLISMGAAEIILFLLSICFGLPLPLTTVQLLWLNMVTNGVQDVGLAFEKEEGDEFLSPPRPPGEPIFNRIMIERVAINALFVGVVSFLVFKMFIDQGIDIQAAQNYTLLLMVLFENIHVLNSRSEKRLIFKIPLFNNPFLIIGTILSQFIHVISMYIPGLNQLLGIFPVSIELWGFLLCLALSILLVDGLYKFTRPVIDAYFKGRSVKA